MERKELKPGDKVWIFHDDKIRQVEYAEFGGHSYLIDFDSVTPVGLQVVFPIEKPHFPSREALCEHYRKIFE